MENWFHNYKWNLQGKVTQVTKASGNATYAYDATGNRVSKQHHGQSSIYIRDASGNTMAVYDQSGALKEMPIYGSQRIGMVKALDTEGQFTHGNRQYEYSNHLGNVLAVSTDKMTAVGEHGDLISASNYYPFGLRIGDRSLNSADYRYGFQGQEEDQETGFVNYKYRLHNPAIGRFFAIDPLTADYPWNSPYAFSENRVLDAVELEGLEAVMVHRTFSDPSTWNEYFAKNMLKATKWNDIQENMIFAKWSGENSAEARLIGSNKIIQEFILSDENPLKDLKHVTLIGHSHGGNVNKVIKNELEAEGWLVDIVNISTPQRTDFQAKTTGEGIYLNFYSTTDIIQLLGISDNILTESNKLTELGGSRIDQKAQYNYFLKTYEKLGNSRQRNSICLPFILFTEAVKNSANWIKESGGHSIHVPKHTQDQIIEKTTEHFNQSNNEN